MFKTVLLLWSSFSLILTTCFLTKEATLEMGRNGMEVIGEEQWTKEVDRRLFEQLKDLEKALAGNKIWKGYSYQAYPQYLVHRDAANQLDRGFLINPVRIPPSAIRLSRKESMGLDVWRYDGHLAKADVALFGPFSNELFEFDLLIGNVEYYLQVYTDDLSRDSEDPTQTVSFSVHENFHRYQNKWEWVPEAQQDFRNFPVLQNLLELQILCQEITKDLPLEKLSKKQSRDLLEQYLAIRTEEINLDSTAGRLIKNHELYQEQMEGSARYIETMASLAVFDKDSFPSTFGYSLFEFHVTNKDEVRGIVGQTVYYGTGASAIYLLDRLGYPIEEMEQGKTPYDLAKKYLALSPQQMRQALARAKSIPNWAAIQKLAAEWANY